MWNAVQYSASRPIHEAKRKLYVFIYKDYKICYACTHIALWHQWDVCCLLYVKSTKFIGHYIKLAQTMKIIIWTLTGRLYIYARLEWMHCVAIDGLCLHLHMNNDENARSKSQHLPSNGHDAEANLSVTIFYTLNADWLHDAQQLLKRITWSLYIILS